MDCVSVDACGRQETRARGPTMDLACDAYDPLLEDDFGDLARSLLGGARIGGWSKPNGPDHGTGAYMCARCGIVKSTRPSRERTVCYDCEQVTCSDASVDEGCLCNASAGTRCVPCAKASGTKASSWSALRSENERQAKALTSVRERYRIQPKRKPASGKYKDPGVSIRPKKPKIEAAQIDRKPRPKPRRKKPVQTFPVYEWMLEPQPQVAHDADWQAAQLEKFLASSKEQA